MAKKKAPPQPIEESSESCLSKTAPFEDELNVTGEDVENINIFEVDRRIALMARIILEKALRANKAEIPLKDKAEMALRAINTLEGVKSRTELWVREEDLNSIPKSVAELERERKEVEERIMQIVNESRRPSSGDAMRDEADAALDALELGIPVKLPEA